MGFKAKAFSACSLRLVCDEPSGATALEYCSLSVIFFYLFISFFFPLNSAPEADVLGSIQTQLQMKQKNIGGQGPVRWRREEDLGGGVVVVVVGQGRTQRAKEIRESR